MICLATPRLLLRTWREQDFDDYRLLRADTEVVRFIGDGNPRGDEGVRASFEAMQRGWATEERGLFALERLTDGALLGLAGLMDCRLPGEDADQIEVGWCLGSQFWGSGYATEAGAAVIDWAFGLDLADELVSVIATENTRSLAVATRLGLEHRHRTILPGSGIWVDVRGIDAERWWRSQ